MAGGTHGDERGHAREGRLAGLAWCGALAGERGAGGAGRQPDCQSRTSCSRWPNRRARQATIRACSAAGNQVCAWSVAAAARRLANWSASFGGLNNIEGLYITF